MILVGVELVVLVVKNWNGFLVVNWKYGFSVVVVVVVVLVVVVVYSVLLYFVVCGVGAEVLATYGCVVPSLLVIFP